jgi:hypothetical protein
MTHAINNSLHSLLYLAVPSLKNLKNKIYKTIILPVVLHWRETWSLTLRKRHRFRVFENRVLRRKFTLHQILLRGSNQEENGRGM